MGFLIIPWYISGIKRLLMWPTAPCHHHLSSSYAISSSSCATGFLQRDPRIQYANPDGANGNQLWRNRHCAGMSICRPFDWIVSRRLSGRPLEFAAVGAGCQRAAIGRQYQRTHSALLKPWRAGNGAICGRLLTRNAHHQSVSPPPSPINGSCNTTPF